MIRYIPGSDLLDPLLYRYTPEERDELVRRLQAKTSAGMLASAAGTRRYFASRRAAKRGTAAEPTTPARVAARLVALTGCSFSTAAWAMADVTRRHVSQESVKTAWHKMYPRRTKK